MGESTSSVEREWWKEAVVYQVYPRSFNDTNGDGVGDIQGVVEKVPYLDDLGVDVVWLSPVYDSPNHDMGYDIRDYRAIMDEMGTMADWDELLARLHDRDLRLVMDLVVNHTSDEHEWFQRSRDPESEYSDWYIWREGDPDEPPNNWVSLFGGPAWTYDERREAWYLHLFDETQPDLNWENLDVREAIYDMIDWWLAKGVDGFRMDAISCLSKPPGLPDGEREGDWFDMDLYFNGPRIHEFMQEMAEATFDNYDVMLIGETPGADPAEARKYYQDGVDMVVHFDHMDITYGPEGKWDIGHVGVDALKRRSDAELDALLNEWDLRDLQRVVKTWDEGVGEDWNCLYLGSHDQARVVSRFGDDDEYRTESAKLIATFLLTQRATPFCYQGDELGMTNADWDSLDDIRDIETHGHVEELMAEYGTTYETLEPVVRNRSRDNARTPIQWDDSEHAGFTNGEPWIQVNDDYEEVNAATAQADPGSILHYYRDLLALRQSEDGLVYGRVDYLLPARTYSNVWAHRRTLGDDSLLVVLNWQDTPTRIRRDDIDVTAAELLLASTDVERPGELDLGPYEARIYRERYSNN